MKKQFCFCGYNASYTEFTRTTAIYPGARKKTLRAVMYLALGMCGECGEVAEHVKKWNRDGVLDKRKLQKELGDVLWYWTRLHDEVGLDPTETIRMNVNKLSSRARRGKLHGKGDDR